MNRSQELLAEGVRLHQAGSLGEAERLYQQVLAIEPDNADGLHFLGLIAYQGRRLDRAVDLIRKAVGIRPDYPEAHNSLGSALRDQGRLDEAIASCRRALDLRPTYPEAFSTLGNALMDRGQAGEAVVCYRKAIELRPDFPEALSNLGHALRHLGRLEEAVACLRQALALRPGLSVVHDNLGSVLKDQGRLDDATFCYSNSALSDAVTAGLQAAADHWRTIAGKPDAEVDAMIRQDEIDILVDLSGHTADNRLAVFAGRAAPVQATWLGYFGTTGLAAMDYILADRFVIPPDEDAQFTESVVRLPDSYLCFAPPDFDVPILARPILERGGAEPAGFRSETALVLGCFNNWAKVGEGTVSLWARILSELPGSRLLLKTRGLDNPEIQREAAARFARHGIAPDRLILEGPSSRAELLAAYNRVDVALDPFPYGGGTTTAEALWMGVPVVTLRGDRWVGRVSESILAAVGLPGLVAADRDGYAAIVRRLARDRAWRDELRRTLRATMEASPLCDGPRFASALETAYRTMWRKWCAQTVS